MKHSIFLFVVVLFSVSNLVGQEPTNDVLNPSWNHAENRHELKFHVGLGLLLNEYHSMILPSLDDYYSSIYSSNHGDERSYGCFTLKYSYDFFDMINAGMEISYQRDYYDIKYYQYFYIDGTMIEYMAKRYVNSILIMPSFEFKYLNKEYVQLYGKVNAGVGLFNYKDKIALIEGEQIHNSKWSPRFIAHFSPIGVRVGKKYAGIVELGFGAQAFLSLGFSAKF